MSKEKEGDKTGTVTQKEAKVRKSLVSDNSGNYSVTYDLIWDLFTWNKFTESRKFHFWKISLKHRFIFIERRRK